MSHHFSSPCVKISGKFEWKTCSRLNMILSHPIGNRDLLRAEGALSPKHWVKKGLGPLRLFTDECQLEKKALDHLPGRFSTVIPGNTLWLSLQKLCRDSKSLLWFSITKFCSCEPRRFFPHPLIRSSHSPSGKEFFFDTLLRALTSTLALETRSLHSHISFCGHSQNPL